MHFLRCLPAEESFVFRSLLRIVLLESKVRIVEKNNGDRRIVWKGLQTGHRQSERAKSIECRDLVCPAIGYNDSSLL